MTFVDVNRNGGPTAPTIARAEAAALEDPRPSTLSKFDAGLRWMPGSAAGTYWDCAEPVPREQPRRPRQQSVLEPAGGSIVIPLEQVLGLMKANAQLNDLIDGNPSGRLDPVEMRRIVQPLNQHISAIVGAFVTDLLERNPKTPEGLQPLLEYAFDELLNVPVSTEDPEREEKLYRRWLLGHRDGIDDELVEKFRQRLRHRTPRRKASAN